MNKNSNPVRIFVYLGVAGEDSASTQIIPDFRNCPKPVELGSSY